MFSLRHLLWELFSFFHLPNQITGAGSWSHLNDYSFFSSVVFQLSNTLKIITGKHFKGIKRLWFFCSPNLGSANNKVMCSISSYWNKINSESPLFTTAVISFPTPKSPLVNITFLSLRLNFLPILLTPCLITSSGKMLHQLHILL